VIEEKCFRIPERIELEQVAADLDRAFGEGWRYIAHFPVDRGMLLVLARDKEHALSASNGKTRVKVRAR